MGQDTDDRLAAHPGNDHCVCILRADAAKAVAAKKAQAALYTVLLRCAAGVIQRRPANIGSNGGGYAAPLQQIDRQITVICPYIRQAGTLGNQISQKP